MKLLILFKKPLLIICYMLISVLAFGQNSTSGKAFSDGIWTLVGASNGVELYVTHVKYTIPGVTDRFNVTVYGKVVNTTDDNMNSPLAYGVWFRYINMSNVLASSSFGLPQDLRPRQTIVKALTITTKVFEIRYGDDLINPLVFNKR